MKLRELKARVIARLIRLEPALVAKYGERGREVAQMLVLKTEALRTFTMPHYLSLLFSAAREFPELREVAELVAESVDELEED